MTPTLPFCLLLAATGEAGPLTLDQIPIRDPFILPVPEEGRYYLYGTSWPLPQPAGFVTWHSPDLVHWTGPQVIFRDPEGYRSKNHWAPEVYRYQGRYYLFGTFYEGEGGPPRHTRVLVADSPAGPFTFHSPAGLPPRDWFTLDGGLFVEDDVPYLVFCHEWVQAVDGTICALPLTADLRAAAGEPVLLFRASEAPWCPPAGADQHRVTDGPFLHRTAAGELLMLWSSFGDGGYQLAVARSESGKLRGPWRQQETPIYRQDGGHGMLFRTFAGELLATFHQPNRGRLERARLFRVTEQPGTLALQPF